MQGEFRVAQKEKSHSIVKHIIGGGAVAQSVERATPGKEVSGSIPAVAVCSLLVGSVSV